MPFVMPNERIAEIRALAEPARFTVVGVAVEFQTTPSFVKAVLPPGFEPADEPTGLVRIGNMQSELCGDFSACTTILNARFGKWQGQYCLSMLISGDMPVTVGREFWGEIKKNASSALHIDGSRVYAYGSRNGYRVAEIDSVVGDDLGPTTTQANALEIKSWMSATGGLEAPPRVFVHQFTSTLDWIREGPASLRLNSSPLDPLGEIPIVRVGKARHYSGESVYRILASIELEDGDRYLPYIYGRAYDDLTQLPKAARYRAPESTASAG